MKAMNQWAFVEVSPKAEGYTTEAGIYVPTTPDEVYVHGRVINGSEDFPADDGEVIVFAAVPRPLIKVLEVDYFLVQDKEIIATLSEDEATLDKSNLVSLEEIQSKIAEEGE